MGKFTKTFLYRIGADWNMDDVISCSQYDLLAVQGFRWASVNGDTWGELKKLNPNILIFGYYGSHSNDNEDHKINPFKGTMGRWNISRGHSMGNTNVDNSHLFYLNSDGNRINAGPAYPHSWAMNYGDPRYQKYWLEAYVTDNVNQPWQTDGVMVDTIPVRFAGLNTVPAGFTDMGWRKDIQEFANGISNGLNEHNTIIWGNTGTVRSQEDIDAYIGLDNIENPIYMGSPEGAYVVSWGSSDCQFYPERDWVFQISTPRHIHRMKFGAQSSVGGAFRTNEYGHDNFDRPLSLYDALWYGLCSHHLGKNTIDNNTYFSFHRYSSGTYYDEFDIDLGEAIGTFKVTNIGGDNIYFREFKLGYVYVNPTRNDVSNISLPVTCKRLTHDNFRDNPTTIPDNDMLSLESNRGTMLLKTVPDQPCDGVVCDNVCIGPDLYSQKCDPDTGTCVNDQLIEMNSVQCVSDPCEGVVCPIICVGDDMWSQRCDPATGQCELHELIEQDSINCKIPDKIPTDETTIKTYLILGGLGIVALAILSMKK